MSFEDARSRYGAMFAIAHVHKGVPRSVLREVLAPYVFPRNFRVVICSRGERRVGCYESHRGRKLWERRLDSRSDVLVVSRDGRYCACETELGFSVMAISTGAEVHVIKTQRTSFKCVAFSRDSIVVSADGSLMLSELGTWRHVWKVVSSRDWEFLAFSTSGAFLAHRADGVTVRNTKTGDRLWHSPTRDPNVSIEELRFSHDDKRVIAVGIYPGLYVVEFFDAKTGAFTHHFYPTTYPTFSDDSRFLAFATYDPSSPSVLKHTTTPDGDDLTPSPTLPGAYNMGGIAISSTGDIMIAWHDDVTFDFYKSSADFLSYSWGDRAKSGDDQVRVVGTVTLDGAPIHSSRRGETSTSFAPDGSLIAVQIRHDLRLIEVPSGRLRATIPANHLPTTSDLKVAWVPQ